MSTRTETGTITPEGRPGANDAGLLRLAPDAEAIAPRLVPLPARSTIVIGREPGAGGVRVEQTSVSRAHVRIERAGADVRAIDLGSKNGTFVNGERLRDARALEHGDELRVGDALYKLVACEFTGTAAAPGALPHGFVGGFELGRKVRELALAAKNGNLNVLVLGESGTGKELAARAVHAESGRSGKLQAVNCAAIPVNLFESELFGHRRGAFTGADRDHVGHVRQADGGTLFLDEIGDLPFDAQAKLLRVLEQREVVPVGAARGEHVDIRVVCATHQDLRALVQTGRFRGDLFARLNGFTVLLPALRRRKEDLAVLVAHFLAMRGAARHPTTPELLLALAIYDWPFNVRELASAVDRAVAVAVGQPLSLKHLPDVVQERFEGFGKAPSPLPRQGMSAPSVAGRVPARQRPEPAQLLVALVQHNGNVAALARTLGRDRAQVHRWLRDANIDIDAHRG